MAAAAAQFDWSVTEEKVAELVRRIVAAADPLEVIAFGSRARGDHGPDSDVDLAVILDVPEAEVYSVVPGNVSRGLGLALDLLPMSKERFDRFRPWINSVQNNIDREGVRLYERGERRGKAAPDQIGLG